MGNFASGVVEEQNANGAESLNRQERETLAGCEETIAADIHTFVRVGQALRVIRDGRLYRETHNTFQAYCRDRWDFSRAHCYRLIAAAETMEVLSPLGDILPTAETQVRPLVQFDLADRPQVWQDVQARLGATASRSLTGQVNEIVQCLIRGSDDEPYRRRRTELRKQQREKRRRAEERDQQRISEAHVTTRRQEAPLPDDELTRLGDIASKLKKTFGRTKSSYDAMEVPDDHVANQMMIAIEVSIARLARWVAWQSETKEAA